MWTGAQRRGNAPRNRVIPMCGQGRRGRRRQRCPKTLWQQGISQLKDRVSPYGSAAGCNRSIRWRSPTAVVRAKCRACCTSTGRARARRARSRECSQKLSVAGRARARGEQGARAASHRSREPKAFAPARTRSRASSSDRRTTLAHAPRFDAALRPVPDIQSAVPATAASGSARRISRPRSRQLLRARAAEPGRAAIGGDASRTS